MLSEYDSVDPKIYKESYKRIEETIDGSLDIYRNELKSLVYPLFVHMYLELVHNGHEEEAVSFIETFGQQQEDYYQDDIKRLAMITKKDQMKDDELVKSFRSTGPDNNKYTVRLSRDTLNYLKRLIQDKPASFSIIKNIIQENLTIDIYDGMTRTKQQIEPTIGGSLGEASKAMNKAKVYYGLLKEPEINITIPEEDGDDGGDNQGDVTEKPKKKKQKKDPLLSKKSRSDPNAPSNSRIPLPELRDSEKLDKITAIRESAKRIKLSHEILPSICFYTLLNAHQHQNSSALCAEISEDSSLLAAGFSDSLIRVWGLTPMKLKKMKSSAELELIDKEADDVLYRMMDDKNTFDMKVLHGHSGPVYALSFSPDRTLFLSSSEDATIRLWSLQTWTNVCCYKGHCFPVWDVKFSPHGYYFASCAHDRTARLWATDSPQPLRMLAGHISDVDCVLFHPNSNYIATGSTDRTIRLWDLLNGNCVRYLTGHKGVVHSLCFSNCGRYLVSGGADKKIILWDISNGSLITELSKHTDTIYTLCFSRDGTILASGGNDDCINLWDVARLLDDIDPEDLNHNINTKNHETFLLNSYRTKSTSILTLHFTRRNLLLATGVFH